MKFYKKVFAAILAVTIIVSTPCISFASNSKDNITIVEYEEYHDQINFDNLMILVANKKDIIVDVDPAISLLKKHIPYNLLLHYFIYQLYTLHRHLI